MSFDHEKRVAAHLLQTLEDGTMPPEDIAPRLEEADPALVYLIFAWLRAHYGAGHPASDGVLGRVVAVCQQSRKVASMAREGEADTIVAWFEETHEYGDLDRRDFIDLIVEKLEG